MRCFRRWKSRTYSHCLKSVWSEYSICQREEAVQRASTSTRRWWYTSASEGNHKHIVERDKMARNANESVGPEGGGERGGKGTGREVFYPSSTSSKTLISSIDSWLFGSLAVKCTHTLCHTAAHRIQHVSSYTPGYHYYGME